MIRTRENSLSAQFRENSRINAKGHLVCKMRNLEARGSKNHPKVIYWRKKQTFPYPQKTWMNIIPTENRASPVGGLSSIKVNLLMYDVIGELWETNELISFGLDLIRLLPPIRVLYFLKMISFSETVGNITQPEKFNVILMSNNSLLEDRFISIKTGITDGT